MDILEEARQVISIEIEALQGLRCRLDQSLKQAIDLLYHCQGRVVVSGLGKSGLIGRKIASTFASTGTPAVFLHPSEGVHGDLGIIKREDVVILISNSGETEEMLQIVPTLRRIDVKLIALTGRRTSTLCEYADVVIDIGVEREACPNNLAPTASTTVMLALGDALAIVLLKKKGFNREDFAFLHPGGSIGKRLLTKVDDVMFQGAEVPFVSPDTIMENAIIEMTSKGLGAVLVVDQEKKLLGIFTDGDLRRALKTHRAKLLELPISQLMTTSPTTIASGRLAARAIKLMEDRPSQISVLPVVDASGTAVGLVRLHDIVKKGVF